MNYKTLVEFGVLAALVFTLGSMIFLNPKDLGDRTARERTVKVVAKLPNGSSQGAGVLVEQGTILTVAHIFVDEMTGQLRNNQVPLVLKSGDFEFRSATLKFYDANKDIAILQFSDETKIKPLTWSREWRYGEHFSFLGNGDDGDFQPGHSKLTAVDFVRWMKRVDPIFVYPCDTGKPGFSGTGLYNDKGELLGLFELRLGNGSCGAIRVNEIIFPK